MRKIYILDTTLRDGEQSPGVQLGTDEKTAIALQLERLGIDRIEAGFPAASPGEIKSVQAVAAAVKHSTIAAFSRSVPRDIDAVKEALSGAQDAMLHLFLATSPIHRQYKLNMSKERVLETIDNAISYGKKTFQQIEFSAEDASRTEPEFLCEVVKTAIGAGATIVNLPDTVGYASPVTFGNMFKMIRETVPGIEKVQLSTHCHNDLGMATANTLAAIYNGVDQIEGTINGIGERAGNAAVEEIAMALETRYDVYQAKTTMNLEEIARTSIMVSDMTGMMVPGNKAIVGANAFAHESGVHQDGMLKSRDTYEIMRPEKIGFGSSRLVFGKHSGRHAFKEKLLELGFMLEDGQITEAFIQFKEMTDQKKQIVDQDICKLLEGKYMREAGGMGGYEKRTDKITLS